MKHEVPESIIIRADCANPDDIKELNEALRAARQPVLRLPVDAKLKARTAGHHARSSRSSRAKPGRCAAASAATRVWKVGLGAAGTGKPVRGSRWIWEINNWQYPKMPDGKVQKDDPDDNTADGADMMDATRYGVMTWLGPLEEPSTKVHPTPEQAVWKEALQTEEDEDEESSKGQEYGDRLDEG
jgi:hypothetical protein